MQGRTTPYILGAVVLMLAIIAGFFLFGGDSGPQSTAITQTTLVESVSAASQELGQQVVESERKAFLAPDLDNVYFDFDRYELRLDGRSAIAKNVAWLEQNPDLKLRLEGHCDERGTEEYNLVLGDRRARAVLGALRAGGVDPGRIATVSAGRSQPEVWNAVTEQDHQRNRRVVFVVQKPD